ncbi:MAG: chromosome segregation protein SMC [Desulfobacterales bacterium]|jgi:chromosome segregation protein|nr:chromosome segregation protein SMC [Desulfobacteraceae bacterium]MDY0311437.1 chromosome segregation protein SMC [Desulfobacterales bacterium]
MRLKHLDIVGFKSFYDKAAVSFPGGISAVVGPNGCGKSNIIDALRWVMGEQSAKQLRGKSMEDVIFAGTRGKSPLNMAEVTLTLANDDGTGPVEFKDFSEISITRRQYRSGERAYFINRQPCRLKDILNIFMGSGMGARSYAIIQQGNIGAITDAGPDERRVFIEEAAGITRFKARKQEASGKVSATEQNLARLNDILSEIRRQMTTLQHQARKAAQYKAYRDRIRTLDLRLSIDQYDRLAGRIDELEQLIQHQRDADQGHHDALRQIDAAVAEIRFDREKKNQALSDQKQHRFGLQRETDRLETEAAHLREEIVRLNAEIASAAETHKDLIARHRSLGEEMDQVRQTVGTQGERVTTLDEAIETQRRASEDLRRRQTDTAAALNQANAELMRLVGEEARYRNIQQTAASHRDQLQRRLRRLDEERALAEAKVAELVASQAARQEALESLRVAAAAAEEAIIACRADLEAHHRRLAEQVRHVRSLETQHDKLRTRHGALKKMDDNLEWYRDGVRAVMQVKGDRDGEGADFGGAIVGVLADLITPEPQFAMATEAALGEALQYVVVQTPQAARAAVAYLRRREAGRCGFIPLSCLKPTAPHGSGERLLDHIRVRKGFEAVAEALIGDVRVADHLEEAADDRQNFPRVTLAGDSVTAGGLIFGGSAEGLSGILAKKQELNAVADQLARTAADLDAAGQVQTDLEDQSHRRQQDLQRCSVEKQEIVEETLQAEKAAYRIGEELRHARRHLETLALEQEQAQGEETDADVETDRCEKILADTAARVQAQQSEVARLSAAGENLTAQLAAFDRRIMDLKLERTAVGTGLENSRQTLSRLDGFHRDAGERLIRLEQEITAKTQRLEAAKTHLADRQEALARRYERIKGLDAAIEGHHTELAAIEARLQARDREVAELQAQRNRTLEKIRELEMDLGRQQVRQEAVVQRLTESYAVDLAAARAECRAAAAPAEPGALETELEALRRKISTITDVHLGAIAEYEQLKSRHDFLDAQRADLVKALEDLNQVIRKINKVSQTRFLETLEQVNEKMREVFPRLFEGGTARLAMTDPDAPLETGVEFLIQPPGKKLTRMSLLSGGEKAMAAIAFIFSIFLIKPASFCLLDEIDAPLDDANVTRFNNLLRLIGEKSQIVMITHNKRSMEFADTLLGVTMPQKGISKIVSVNLQKTARAA